MGVYSLTTGILKATGITKKYSQVHKNVLESTSFSIEAGSIHVIEGKSGSGKSTFLSIIGGMEYPSSGKVYYKNESLYDLSDSKQAVIRGKKFGFIFQSFQLIPELTAWENITLPLMLMKRTDRFEERVKELAVELGISSQLDKRPSFLSGGEQQRVAIARALITEPEIIFADEPTGNLDQTTTRSIIKLFTKLNKEKKLSIVIVTHEKNLFEAPHQLYTMKNGVLEGIDKNV
ncbi:ABC transporter [Bacillus sp. SJS]|nr:ABC transporter [Bacillus sp. SJS]